MELLHDLDAAGWSARTACPAWSVHELSVHLVHDDLRRLSAQRDGHPGAWADVSGLDELVVELDRINEEWVDVMAPTLSPRLVIAILEWLSDPSEQHLLALDGNALGANVAWAGSEAHPNWLDVAREYTERWVHQQQVRDAVGVPGLTDERFVAPVVETFASALPMALPESAEGASVAVWVTGPFERSWRLVSTPSGWVFTSDTTPPATTVVEVPVDAFWRRAVRLLSHSEAARAAHVRGDPQLGAAVLDLRAAIVGDG